MSQNRPTDRRTPTDRRDPEFYLPGTPTSSATLERLERLFTSLFRNRGRIRGDRKCDRTEK
ncbi:hypothetical protein [Natrarchaeobaculum sulfurireducens]|uniref:Uncharacterized protein n=1 Tax=Natrarchaeobaculum sulfurireducens TaxID=2044521 RepID=A0A346PLV5_9EURY|nr:hypothetical protein [Natrarchaeobaculum sulfurireducens]AXR80500.1 hypothetical protein AArcMg_0477 [Natrarchaeobaculum sulfurireducens]